MSISLDELRILEDKEERLEDELDNPIAMKHDGVTVLNLTWKKYEERLVQKTGTFTDEVYKFVNAIQNIQQTLAEAPVNEHRFLKHLLNAATHNQNEFIQQLYKFKKGISLPALAIFL